MGPPVGLKKMNIDYIKHDFTKLRDDPPERETELRGLLREAGVAWAMGNEFLPIFVIDGIGMSYPEAMKHIKKYKKNN